MRIMVRKIIFSLVAALLLTPFQVLARSLETPLITDVTPKSFSVVWIAQEPSDPSLLVYDEAMREITAMTSQTPFPTLSQSATLTAYARNSGMLKVRVEGLTPDTQYYFQTVARNDANESVLFPLQERIPVRTEKLTALTVGGDLSSPLANDLLRFQVLKPDWSTGARGSLLVGVFAAAAHPVSAYVGDSSAGSGLEPGFVVLDLNNLYDRTTHASLNLTGGEILDLYALRGNGVQGAPLFHCRLLPADTEKVSVVQGQTGFLPTDFNCDGRVDLRDATLYTDTWGHNVGEQEFNADYDLNGDMKVNGNDNAAFVSDYDTVEQ